MVKLRLTRLGRHKLPFYRLVATDSRQKRDGGYIELLGTYEPFEGKVTLNEELILRWMANGAQPSETVKALLKKAGIYKKFLEQKKVK